MVLEHARQLPSSRATSTLETLAAQHKLGPPAQQQLVAHLTSQVQPFATFGSMVMSVNKSSCQPPFVQAYGLFPEDVWLQTLGPAEIAARAVRVLWCD